MIKAILSVDAQDRILYGWLDYETGFLHFVSGKFQHIKRKLRNLDIYFHSCCCGLPICECGGNMDEMKEYLKNLDMDFEIVDCGKIIRCREGNYSYDISAEKVIKEGNLNINIKGGREIK